MPSGFVTLFNGWFLPRCDHAIKGTALCAHGQLPINEFANPGAVLIFHRQIKFHLYSSPFNGFVAALSYVEDRRSYDFLSFSSYPRTDSATNSHGERACACVNPVEKRESSPRQCGWRAKPDVQYLPALCVSVLPEQCNFQSQVYGFFFDCL